MHRRDWMTVACLLLLIGAAYAYMARADEIGARRDQAAMMGTHT